MSGKRRSHFEELPSEEPEIRTMTDLVKHIENTLGWCAPWDDPRPPWKIRAVEVGKLKRVVAKDPKLYTMDNLLLAVEYLRRKREPVKSPVGVVYAVERALKELPSLEARPDVQERLERALSVVRGWPEGPARRRWERRLAVAQGAVLNETLDEFYELGLVEVR